MVPFRFSNPLDLVGTSVEIEHVNAEDYIFKVFSQSLSTRGEQVEFLTKFSEYVSFLIARGESNPQYGTSFIRPMWIEFKTAHVPSEGNELQSTVTVSDSMAIESTRTVHLHENYLPGAIHTDLLRFYADGLRAEHGKSKYFHWFLILEYLENSEKYRALFNASKLFDETESELIREVAGKMDGPKKSAISNLLSRTREFRNSKLMQMLHQLDISTIKNSNGTLAVTEELIKAITAGRNALFHSGSQFPEEILWSNLFPLATLIVQRVSCDPTLLDA